MLGGLYVNIFRIPKGDINSSNQTNFDYRVTGISIAKCYAFFTVGRQIAIDRDQTCELVFPTTSNPSFTWLEIIN